MKKLYTSLLLLFLVFTNLFAQQRNIDEALSIASDFFETKTSLRSKSAGKSNLSLVYTGKSQKNGLRSNTNDVNYYIFNVNKESGFIIVSGDERANDILGYSDESFFDINNLPDNLKYWLSFYENEIDQLRSSKLNIENSTKGKQLRSTPVSPLLGKIKWNQGTPYNDLCPEYQPGDKSATGCVATAIAQIMKYYEWPINGIGSNTYNHTFKNGSTATISADFSTTTYDWANMTPAYNTSSTTTQNSAVATLMFHCGVAVNMGYGSESGAFSSNVVKALVNNFDYDKSIKYIFRDSYSKKDWCETIKGEIAAGRPVYYAGSSNDGGHAFVCDGYDANDLFHINWGWGGMSNGYFAISALTPETQGIGGSSGGYNFNQEAIIGIQKQAGTSVMPLNLRSGGINNPASVNLDQAFSASLTVYNYGDVATVTLNLGLYDSNNNFITTLFGGSNQTISANIGRTINPMSCKIPSSVADGTYKLFITYQSATDTNWQIVPGDLGGDLIVEVKTGVATFKKVNPELSLISLSAINNLYENKIGKFTASVLNTGKIDLSSMMALKLVAKDNSAIINYIACDPIVIGAGETELLHFSDEINVTQGDYYLSLVYNIKNKTYSGTPNYNDFDEIGTPIIVTVKAEPVINNYSFIMTAGSFPDNDNVTADDFNFTCTIKNNGDYFDGRLYICFNDPSGVLTGAWNYNSFDSQYVTGLDSNESITLNFTKCPDIPIGNYKIGFLYIDLSNQAQFITNSIVPFTLKEESPVGIQENNKSNDVIIYPNPATDKVYITSSDIVNSIEVYDLAGKQVIKMSVNVSGKIQIDVENLIKGTYILRYTTEKDSKTTKFIKK